MPLPPLQPPKREKLDARLAAAPPRKAGWGNLLPGPTTRTISLMIRRRQSPQRRCAFAVLVFWFFRGRRYPGGMPSIRRVLLQAIWGGYLQRCRRESLHLEKEISDRALNGPMLLYVLVTLARYVILAPMATSSGRLRLPPLLEGLWPWRWLIALGLATLALLLVITQSSMGFGLERAVSSIVQDQVAQLKLPADTPEEQQIVDLNAGMFAGRLHMQRTWWWRLALTAHLAAVLGLAAEWFLHRRANPLPPRGDFQW